MSTALSIDARFYGPQFPSFRVPEWQRSAVSYEAEEVSKRANAVIDAIEHSQALFGERAAAISQLSAIADECRDEGWDGHDADATDARAVLLAEYFVRSLPDDIPLPEFAPEPDGSISLDWIQTRNRLFSVSVGAKNRLAYAWVDGTDGGHAVAHFNGQEIPQRILQGIRAIVS